MNRTEKLKVLEESSVAWIKTERRKNLTEVAKGEDGTDGRPGERGFVGERGERGFIGQSGDRGVPGIKGVKGDHGVPGRDGIDGHGIVWRAQWQVRTDYSVNDAVFNYGSAYICTKDHESSRDNEPSVGAEGKKFWAILAERGESGPGGSAGAPGIQGIQGTQGPMSTSTLPTATKSGDYTLNTDDYNCIVTAAATITLPTAVGVTGRMYNVKASTGSTVTVATTSAQTIDGSSTYVFATQNNAITVLSDGSNWFII
jgi:hypothetical protein